LLSARSQELGQPQDSENLFQRGARGGDGNAVDSDALSERGAVMVRNNVMVAILSRPVGSKAGWRRKKGNRARRSARLSIRATAHFV